MFKMTSFMVLLAFTSAYSFLRGGQRQLQSSQYAMASVTGYEYTNPPGPPSCQGSGEADPWTVVNGVAMSNTFGMAPGMCGKCFRLSGAPEQIDEHAYEQIGNTANAGWSMIVKVVDTCAAPSCSAADVCVNGACTGLSHVFDLPTSMFEAASNPHAGAHGIASGYIPIKYEEVDCGDDIIPTATPTPAPTPAPTADGACAAAWGQCGGQNWQGAACCSSGYTCVASSQWYSQCKPATDPTPTPTPAPTPTAPTPVPTPAPTEDDACAAAWGQCGGQNWQGAACCSSGYTCVASSQWYSQCKPARK